MLTLLADDSLYFLTFAKFYDAVLFILNNKFLCMTASAKNLEGITRFSGKKRLILPRVSNYVS